MRDSLPSGDGVRQNPGLTNNHLDGFMDRIMNPNAGIVLTGCGWVLPHTARDTLPAQTLAAGSFESLMDRLAELAAAPSSAPYPAVPDDLLETQQHLSSELKRDKGSWMTAMAIEQAMKQAALDRSAVGSERLGLVLGSSLAGQLGMIQFASEVREQSPRFVSPINFPQTVGNYIAGAIARAMDLRGPNSTLASGNVSGLDAILEACELLASNQADAVLAGATEVLTDATARAFRRGSSTLLEGAVWMVLQRAEHAVGRKGLAEVRSWSRSASCSPSTSPMDSPFGSLSGPLAMLASIAQARGVAWSGAWSAISPPPSVMAEGAYCFEIAAGEPDAGESQMTLIVPCP
jgi:hypothetical protein